MSAETASGKIFGARYYAPWLGRWTSADPLGIGADGPGLYNYVRGSPIVLHDPNGTEGMHDSRTGTGEYILRQAKGNTAEPSRIYRGAAKGALRAGVLAAEGMALANAPLLTPPQSIVDTHNALDEAVEEAFPGITPGEELLGGAILNLAGLVVGAALGGSLTASRAVVANAVDDVALAGRTPVAAAETGVASAEVADAAAATAKAVPDAPATPAAPPAPASAGTSTGSSAANAARRAELNLKFGRSGDLDRDINYRGVVQQIEDNATQATNAARGAGLTNASGRLGSRAHQIFEQLTRLLNQRIKNTGFDLVPEQFRGPSPRPGTPGPVVPRRSSGSKGLDVVMNENGSPIEGFDLKTGRGWTPRQLQEYTNRFLIPIRELFR